MAAIPPTRTRSLRAAAPSLSRPLQQGSSNASSTTTTRRPQAVVDAGPSPSVSLFLTNLRLLDLDLSPDWPGITASTFTVTGSGAIAAQAQKRRVACVEWALYRLFEIYDVEETKKLRPFFPPVDQVSSVNLRAALLKALEGVKKSGLLGKDVVLRKTMLDDCRGERVEEVLGSFSTVVLKSVVAAEEHQNGRMPIAVTMALESRGYKDEKMDLVVMGTVYRAVLRRMLERRKAMGCRYKDFAELLMVRETGVKRRMEEVKALNEVDGNRNRVSREAVKEMRTRVRNNWSGSEGWMEALMFGDGDGCENKGVFGMDFERVWRRVEAGREDELETGGEGLVEGLERRGRAVNERVKRWERFKEEMGGGGKKKDNTGDSVLESGERTGLDLGFGEHERFKIGGDRVITEEVKLGASRDLHDFRRDLEQDLERASGSAGNPLETLGWLFEKRQVVPKKDSSKPEEEHDDVSEISDLEEEIHEEIAAPTVRRVEGIKRGLARPKLSQPTRSIVRKPGQNEDEDEEQAGGDVGIGLKKTSLFATAPKLPRPARTVPFERGAQDAPKLLPARTRGYRITSGSRSRSISPEKQQPQVEQHQQLQELKLQREMEGEEETAAAEGRNLKLQEELEEEQRRQQLSIEPQSIEQQQEMIDHVEEQEPISPTQELADEILENIRNASPSPAKPIRHKLSLADRTRLSMARGSLLFTEDEEPEIPARHMAKPVTTAAAPVLPEHPGDDEEQAGPAEDLVSRTRRSMAGFEKARQKAQMERRRSVRQSKLPGQGIREGSYFEKLSEEKEEDEDRKLLEEQLMGEQVEEEMVFRSRPKVKDSPMGSPTREW